MHRLSVPEQIGAFEHARHSFDCRGVQWDDAMARLVLAPFVVDRANLVVWWRVPAPQNWPRARAFRIAGRWIDSTNVQAG
jgi:hypothetical protein